MLRRWFSSDKKDKAVTSSLRATVRLLRANGGWRSAFRGLLCLLVQGVASGILVGIFASFMPRPFASVASLLASLALVQLSTAWVHIVMTPSSPRPFWRRLPRFRRAFDAAAKPVALFWLADELTGWIPLAVALALGFRAPEWHMGNAKPTVPEPREGDVWRALVVFVVGVACQFLLRLPAHVVLVRVQASLLPVEDDAVVPFDRSFGGTVEPEVVGGKGYASIAEAWNTFGRPAWKRLILLYVKITLVGIAAYVLMFAVIAPQAVLIYKHSAVKN
jgi:hypothetical protein